MGDMADYYAQQSIGRHQSCEHKLEHFKKLNAIDCNGKTEKKNGLTYLSWTYAWENVKKHYPEATYQVIKFNNLPYMFDEKTGYMVFTEVTIEGINHEMWLPVMDGANKAMKDKPYEYSTKFGKKVVESATMFDINKTIMRCLTKNLAMFGMGLYIYSGEDLPEVEKQDPKQDDKPEPKQANKPEPKQASEKEKSVQQKIGDILLEMHGKDQASEKLKEYTSFIGKDGKEVEGVDSLTKLNDARAKATYGKVKKLYEEFKNKAS